MALYINYSKWEQAQQMAEVEAEKTAKKEGEGEEEDENALFGLFNF